MKRDFLHVSDFTSEEIIETLELAKWVKNKFKNRENYFPFDNQTMAMIFAKPSGKEHTVWAKAVTYNDMIYFSRRNPNSDWLKNAIAHPQVKVKFDGKEFSGIARLVEEEELAKKISSLKYTDENRQKESRIVLEVKLND